MVRLLRIERSITWMARALTANRDANPTPEGILDAILPGISIFGSQRLAEVQVETVVGGAGAIEIFHSQVPVERVRHYLSLEYFHNDLSNPTRVLRPGRIIPTAAGFPFAGFRDAQAVAALVRLAVRNISLGPLHRIAVQVNTLGLGTVLEMTVVWIEMPLGEYLTGVE